MAETYINREQFAQLYNLLAPSVPSLSSSTSLREWLAGIDVKVEDDQTVRDEEISDANIGRMACAHGYHIGSSVTVRDMTEEYPWLNEAEADEVAWDAADIMGDSSNISESRGYAIDHALDRKMLPTTIAEETWTDARGLHWTPLQYLPAGETGSITLLLWCSDGRVFEEEGSSWHELNADEKFMAVARLAGIEQPELV